MALIGRVEKYATGPSLAIGASIGGPFFLFCAAGGLAQIIATNPFFRPGHKMLAIMPMFHGFGLGVSIHSMVANGGHCILIPRFTPQSYAELIKKHKPNLIAGVPSLFEALLRVKEIEGADLSCLKGVFSGGDSLSIELKKKFDKFLKDGSLCAPLIPGCFSQSPGIVNEKAYQDFMRKEKIFCKALKKGKCKITVKTSDGKKKVIIVKVK